jgi:hypothetical protein
MTGLPVEHRFENHKNGFKSAWTVKKYGIRLMPELYEHLNPMPFEAAAQMEKDLTEDLRAEGYTVTGGTWQTIARVTCLLNRKPAASASLIENKRFGSPNAHSGHNLREIL